MIVVLSQFRIANGMATAVKKAFQNRPHQVDAAEGFMRMEVLSPREQPDEIWLMTWWRDEESYRVWHHSHAYKEAHRGIPKGLKLTPKSTVLRFFEHVAD